MNKTVGLIGAAGLGAGLMYVFDPDRGKRRRTKLRDKAKHFNRIAIDTAGKTGRDVRNHLLGVYAEMGSMVRCEKVSDNVLQARIRSKLGRVVSHPRAIEVKVVDGVAILSGPILAEEVHPLLDAIQSMDGVKNIENILEIHEDAGDIPALQGGRRRFGERFGPFKTKSPTGRLIAGVAGGGLAIYGGKRRGALGSLIGTVGLGLLAQALTNFDARRLVGVDVDARPHENDVVIEPGLPPPDVAGKPETILHSQVV